MFEKRSFAKEFNFSKSELEVFTEGKVLIEDNDEVEEHENTEIGLVSSEIYLLSSGSSLRGKIPVENIELQEASITQRDSTHEIVLPVENSSKTFRLETNGGAGLAEKLSRYKRMGKEHFSSPVMVVEGTTGQVELYEDKIKITREGSLAKLNHLGKGSKEILLDQITSIQLKKPGLSTKGYIQFGQSGYSESKGGVFDATKDENSVTYPKKKHEEFEELKHRINELRKEDSSNEEDSSSPLQRLKERFAEGEIDEEEYRKRKRILEEE